MSNSVNKCKYCRTTEGDWSPISDICHKCWQDMPVSGGKCRKKASVIGECMVCHKRKELLPNSKCICCNSRGNCIHCGKERYLAARGLCSLCHKDKEVRRMYGQKIKTRFNHGSVIEMYDNCSPPQTPTNYFPGTEGKIRAMATRAVNRELLFHPQDAKANED